MFKPLYPVIFIFAINGCAQLPPSTVTLSNSISNDLTNIQSSHLDFVNFYFDGLEASVNQFIDEQYKPAYIKERFAQQYQRALSSDPKEQSRSLFIGIGQAFSGELELDDLNCLKGSACYEKELALTQNAVLEATNSFLSDINQRIEQQREELIGPLKEQRKGLLTNLQQQYANVQGKNAVVTSMLASIVEVHETQQELLSMLGVKEDVRTEIGTKLSALSQAVANGVRKIDDKEQELSALQGKINNIKQAFKDIK
jgi:hypothetical protein